MPRASPGSPLVRAKTMSWVASWSPLLKRFSPSITQSSPSRTARGLEPRRVAAVVGLGQPEGEALRARDHALEAAPPSAPGCRSAWIMWTCGKLPTIDDSFWSSLWRPSPLCARCSRMIAIARLRAVLPAELFGQRVAQMPGAVGAAAHLGEQLLPLAARRPVGFPVGARVLAAMIEDTAGARARAARSPSR